MAITSTSSAANVRQIWRRKAASLSSSAPGAYHDLIMSEIGNAAARETLTTATSHFAAIWTDLFESMLADDSQLIWRENGPGIGRDARIAFSSLLGRYVARAYLTQDEGVRVLIPLDVAKRILIGTPYYIAKDPEGRGLEADWVGLDRNRLVIVEAKGTYDIVKSRWCGPDLIPRVLETAIGQVERTAVFRRSSRTKLPAKRWAVASRWGTVENDRIPSLLAWDPEEGILHEDDYRSLAKILHRADLESVLLELGHPQAIEILNASEPSSRFSGDLEIRCGRRTIEPSFVAIAGPIGLVPLRREEDLDFVTSIRNLSSNIALLSLSSRYASTIIREPSWSDDDRTSKVPDEYPSRFAKRAGLSVLWPKVGEEIALIGG